MLIFYLFLNLIKKLPIFLSSNISCSCCKLSTVAATILKFDDPISDTWAAQTTAFPFSDSLSAFLCNIMDLQYHQTLSWDPSITLYETYPQICFIFHCFQIKFFAIFFASTFLFLLRILNFVGVTVVRPFYPRKILENFHLRWIVSNYGCSFLFYETVLHSDNAVHIRISEKETTKQPFSFRNF